MEAKTVKCIGEAHSNPLIDNCQVCVPYWAEYPICPKCHWKLHQGPSGKIFTCGKCHKRYVWDRQEAHDTNQMSMKCGSCPEFHQFKYDDEYGYCPLAEGTVRVDDPCCDDGKKLLGV